MGVYIKGQEMPNNCTECFKHNKCDKYHIEIVKNEDGDFLPTYIADNCPLIEVTEPHGRLIDEAEVRVIMHQVCARSIRTYEATECAIRNMKAVIEAEGE